MGSSGAQSLRDASPGAGHDLRVDATYLVDDEGRVLELDAGTERLLGWRADEAVGHRSIDLFVERERRERMMAVFGSVRHHSAMAATGGAIELTLRHRSGRAIDVLARFEERSDDRHGAVLVRLTRQEAPADRGDVDWLEGVARVSSDAIISVDAGGIVRALNPAAERLYRCPAATALGRPLGANLPPMERRRVDDALARVRGGERLAASRQRFDVPGEPPVWTETTATASFDERGAFVGATFISRDATAEARTRDEIEAQLSRLRALGPPPTSGGGDTEDVGPVVGRVLARALPHLRLDTVWASRLEQGVPVVDAVAGDPEVLGPEVVAGHVAEPTRSVCRAMLDGVVPTVVDDVRGHDGLATIAAASPGLGAYVGAPVVLADGTILGALGAGSREALDVNEADQRVLALLADVVAGTVDEARTQERALRTRAEQATVDSLLAALAARDHYTADHTNAVVELSDRLAGSLGLDPETREQIALVARLHDVGKVGIPDVVLRKPGPLAPVEWELMCEHPAIGERIVASVGSLAHIAAAVRAEHERWDGTGYPDGLAGDDIPLPSRVVLVCDAWHAMISDRPYRAGLDPVDAIAELRRCAGTQFDPDLAGALATLLDADVEAGA